MDEALLVKLKKKLMLAEHSKHHRKRVRKIIARIQREKEKHSDI